MTDNEKQVILAKELTESWRSYREERDISLHEILDEFYLSNINPKASEGDLFNHRERFKKATKRNAEVSGLYKYYFVSKYLEHKSVTNEDRSAAWELHVELVTRVSSVKLEQDSGCNMAALNSLHSLFDSWRSIARNGGVKSLKFLKHTKPYFDEILRPFTSKWHTQLNDSSKTSELFRIELEQLQLKSQQYCDELEQDFFIGMS